MYRQEFAHRIRITFRQFAQHPGKRLYDHFVGIAHEQPANRKGAP
jgi:hypothetical protein